MKCAFDLTTVTGVVLLIFDMTESQHQTTKDLLAIFIVLLTFGIYLIVEELSKINKNLTDTKINDNIFIDNWLGVLF